MDEAAKALAPGELVRLAASDGRPLGTYGFNPHTLIAARRLSRDPMPSSTRASWQRGSSRRWRCAGGCWRSPIIA